MSVVLSIEEVGPCRKAVKIEVPSAIVDAEKDRVVQQLRRTVKVPGFRKGKASAEMVRKRFSEDVEEQVLETLLPRYWKQAAAEAQLSPMMAPQVESVEHPPGENLTFVASVEVRPEIEIGELAPFSLPEADLEVAAAEIDEAVEGIRRDVAEWVDVERAAARGDRIQAAIAEMPLIIGAEPPPGQPVAFEVGDPSVWEELSLAVTGLTAGGATEFSRREGEGEEAAEKKYRVEVTAVQERDLPEVDDAFAAKLGEFENLEALRTHVAERIAAGKADQLAEQRERALVDELRERYPVELPEGVVDEEVRTLLTEYAESLQMRGVDVEKAGIDWNRVAGEARPQAERRVHARLLLDAVADSLSIEVEESELEEALSTIGKAQNASAAQVRQALSGDGRLEGLRDRLRRSKTVRHFVDGPRTADESEEESEGSR